MAARDYEGPPQPFTGEIAKRFRNYARIVAQYPVKLRLSGEDGKTAAEVAQLRPEPFVCRRITWATTGDTLLHTGFPGTWLSSIHGQSVACRFGDSFTTFLGKNNGLVTAVFGDSNGFLDLSHGIIFQGSQPIKIDLERLFWPGEVAQAPANETDWYFIFHGVGLLPAGVNQSGSA